MLKKIAFAFLGFLLFLPVSAQDFSKFLEPLAAQYDLNKDDVKSYRVSHSYFREATQMQHVYLQQTVNDIPIFNALFQLHLHQGDHLKFHNCAFVPNALARVDQVNPEINMQGAFDLIVDYPSSPSTFSRMEPKHDGGLPSDQPSSLPSFRSPIFLCMRQQRQQKAPPSSLLHVPPYFLIDFPLGLLGLLVHGSAS
jgi:hypothetical protein